MKFGVSINPARPLVSEIERVSKLGIDFVEINIEPPLNSPVMLVKKASLIKKALQSNNLFGIGHAYPLCELGHPDITVRAAWLLELKQVVNAAAKLGLKRIDIHANPSFGYLPKELQSIVMDNLVSSFAFIIEIAKPHGIAIAIENTWEFPSEYEHLISKVKNLHGTLDIGHAFMRGGMAAIKDFLKIKAVDHLHIHDARREMEHLPIGDGKIQFEQVAGWLKKRNYNDTAMIEVISSDTAVKKSLDKFREFVKD